MFLNLINTKRILTVFALITLVVMVLLTIQAVSSVSTQAYTGAYVASEISVSGGNGRVKASDGEMALTITYTAVSGTQCSWKSFWSDGTQIGSEQRHACGKEGKESYLEWLSGKIGESWSEALKAFEGW